MIDQRANSGTTCARPLLGTVADVYGQAARQPPASPKAAAPIDLTGYWVSLVTEDWSYRMLTPPKGDFISVPLNLAGRKAGASGIHPRTKLRESSAEPTVQTVSCAFPGAFTSAGKMTTHSSWKPTPAPRLGCSTSEPQSQGGDWQGVLRPVGTGPPARSDSPRPAPKSWIVESDNHQNESRILAKERHSVQRRRRDH